MPPRAPQPLTQKEIATAKAVLNEFETISWVKLDILGLLAGGYFNRNYLIGNSTPTFVLRRYDLNKDPATIEYEHELLRALPAELDTASIAKPLRNGRGETIVTFEGKHYSLFHFLAGHKPQLSRTSLFPGAGYILAAYHNAVRRYTPTPRQRQGYGTVQCLDWVAAHAGGLDKLWPLINSLPVRDAREQLIRDSLDFLEEESVIIQSILLDKVYDSIPQLVIHNDVGPQNILCIEDRIVALLDFDLVAWDARAYDLATTLMWFSEDSDLQAPFALLPGDRRWILNLKRSQALFHAYCSDLEEGLTPAEIDLLPTFMRAFGLWLAIWYLDLRVGRLEWYPEEISGLIPFLRWFRNNAQFYVTAMVNDAST